MNRVYISAPFSLINPAMLRVQIKQVKESIRYLMMIAKGKGAILMPVSIHLTLGPVFSKLTREYFYKLREKYRDDCHLLYLLKGWDKDKMCEEDVNAFGLKIVVPIDNPFVLTEACL